MIPAPSSTWFTASPDWQWFITLYFFLGGLAGGSYVLAALIDLYGRAEERRLAHIGYYIPLPCVALSGLLLSIDLGRPLRFWHMLIESNTYWPMFKYWSPMSSGAWALTVFGLFSTLSFLAVLAEDSHLVPAAFRRLRPPSPLGKAIVVLGSIAGLYLAGYTGVLLAVTNRPIWADTPLLGMLFIVSAASTSAALIMLLAHRSGSRIPVLANLHRMDDSLMVLELLVLAALVVSLGPVARAWLNGWGALLSIVVVVGLIVPLAFSWLERHGRRWNVVASTVLVLIGGLLLRIVIVFSSDAI